MLNKKRGLLGWIDHADSIGWSKVCFGRNIQINEKIRKVIKKNSAGDNFSSADVRHVNVQPCTNSAPGQFSNAKHYSRQANQGKVMELTCVADGCTVNIISERRWKTWKKHKLSCSLCKLLHYSAQISKTKNTITVITFLTYLFEECIFEKFEKYSALWGY